MSSKFLLGFLSVLAVVPAVRSETFTHQVTGLFMKERAQDLRELFRKILQVKLVDIDFEKAEATFEYDPSELVPKGKPEQVLQKLDNLVRMESRGTFGVKPRSTLPQEKLKLIVIPVAGLDCKACSLAAYEAVYKLEGVERATASFRDGHVTALIDPDKADRARLEAALKKKGVEIRSP